MATKIQQRKPISWHLTRTLLLAVQFIESNLCFVHVVLLPRCMLSGHQELIYCGGSVLADFIKRMFPDVMRDIEQESIRNFKFQPDTGSIVIDDAGQGWLSLPFWVVFMFKNQRNSKTFSRFRWFLSKANRQRKEYGIPFTALPSSTHGQEILLNCFVWNTCPKSKTPCV